jgi:hypothetical protein
LRNNKEEIMNDFFNQFPIAEAIQVMWEDVTDLKIKDERVFKLLRLASCKASPDGEKTNAGRAAFKLIAKIVN